MPGCGLTSDPPEQFRIRDYVACLAGFIAALGLEQTHVLGLSFGTGLALKLYRADPELVRSLILASAYAGWAGWLPPEAWAREWLPTLSSDSTPPEMMHYDRQCSEAAVQPRLCVLGFK
jgi:pimeloyl-ACP methyl ester carboxylesterase